MIFLSSFLCEIYNRPTSVLPVVSKVFETVIHEQLSDYFLSNNLFSAQQYGFRKNSSTELAAPPISTVKK